MMKSKEEFLKHIRKTGTSLGISIPPEVIKILKLKENDIVRVAIETVKNQRFLWHRKSKGFSSEAKKYGKRRR